MNAPEKKVLLLALFLFGMGWVVHFSPWNPVPAIETFPYVPGEVSAAESAPAVVSDFTAAPHARKARKVKSAKPSVHFPVAINRASAEELCALKGVGPKLAERILAYRRAQGFFKSAADLRKVSGIGEKKAAGILPFVIFD